MLINLFSVRLRGFFDLLSNMNDFSAIENKNFNIIKANQPELCSNGRSSHWPISRDFPKEQANNLSGISPTYFTVQTEHLLPLHILQARAPQARGWALFR